MRFIVALDRCTDATQAVVQRHAKIDSRVEVMPYPKLGKGGVIMETLRRCEGDVLAFVDADCATPPVELLRLVEAAEHADIAIATRWHPAAVVPAHRSLGRRLSSAGFAWGVRRLFGLPYRDTQCGAKVIRREAAEQIVPLLSSRDFLFDVDLLVTARSLGMHIVEVPTVWVDQAGSRLNASRDARRMAASAMRLWLHNQVLPVHAEHTQAEAKIPAGRGSSSTIDLREGPVRRTEGPSSSTLRRRRLPTMTTPDVTLISPYPDPRGEAGSGVGWYTQFLAQGLVAAGAEVAVIAPRLESAPDVQHDGRVAVHRPFDRGPLGLLRAARAAIGTGAPLVHMQHEVFLYGGPQTIPAALPAVAALRAARRGPVLTMHQVVDPAEVDQGFTELHRVPVPATLARLGLGALQSGLYGFAHSTIVHQAAFLKILPEAHVLPIGADQPSDDPRGDGAAMRAAWSLSPDEFVVLCFGFVAPYKGLETVLEGAERAGRPVRVVVAGAEHPRLVGQGYLQSLQDRYGSNAVFTGYVDDSDVNAWFDAADVVTLAYPRVFSSSGVLPLAIAHRTPLLLSDAVARVHGAPAELVVDLDPDAVAARIDALVREPGRIESAAAATQSMHLAGRSWADLALRHLDLYQEVTDAQSRARHRDRHGPDRREGPVVSLLDVPSGVRSRSGGGAMGQASGGLS